MCAILVPALIGVAALGLLGGGVGGNCGSDCITIPQQAGEGTNVVYTQQQQYAYAQPQQSYGYAGQQAYAPQQSYGPQYGVPAPQYGAPYNSGIGAGVDVNGQSAVGAGAYADPNGVGLGANVGGVDASIGLGARNY